ncbi:F0F1 ATP synthase subunit delta [Candidatus Saccharibacteria bacterium]|nr:F0F1 ATP synthase subunit delta [Candidatus Saccharibacteria bacterium]
MIASRHHLAEVIATRTLHRRSTQQLAQAVAAYLLAEHKTADLESLIRDIMQYRSDLGIVEAVAVSAHDLNRQVIKDIRLLLKQQYPKAQSIVIDDRQDPELVGGVRIDLANEQLDLTTRAKLNQFKRLTGAGKD